ncbi:MAG: hypothetical protein MK226_15350 [Saprospiraceae bacterium]|nr:hypothetical protein [Saprospiraceae bacterium]
MKPKWDWKKYVMEFISIFIAVISAFALTNWNENRREEEAATKILLEISNGLQKDLEDIRINVYGHKEGIKACQFWRAVLSNQEVNYDSLYEHYINLTRDFFSVQNNSGYETLKSRGLELLKNDSLRFDIISLYEYDYKSLKTMEEDYYEMQFQENYFKELNDIIAPNFEFDSIGNIASIQQPLRISQKETKLILTYLWKIQVNRNFILKYYGSMEEKIQKIDQNINMQIER